MTSLDIDVTGGGSIVLKRIDSDLLPDGAVGIVDAFVGTAQVASHSNALGEIDTLHVNVTDPSA